MTTEQKTELIERLEQILEYIQDEDFSMANDDLNQLLNDLSESN